MIQGCFKLGISTQLFSELEACSPAVAAQPTLSVPHGPAPAGAQPTVSSSQNSR